MKASTTELGWTLSAPEVHTATSSQLILEFTRRTLNPFLYKFGSQSFIQNISVVGFSPLLVLFARAPLVLRLPLPLADVAEILVALFLGTPQLLNAFLSQETAVAVRTPSRDPQY